MNKLDIGFTCNSDREADALRKLSVVYGSATVPYKGNGVWSGLKGKKLVGEEAALEYAKRLNILIKAAALFRKLGVSR